MVDYSQITLVVGVRDRTEGTVRMLGTGILISNEGKIVTARHVVGNTTEDLVVLLPHISSIDEYQDTTDTSCKSISATVEDINPVTDICILKIPFCHIRTFPPLESLDNVKVGERIGIYGFPHCVMGRRVLTYQEAEIGAKMLLECSGIKSKYATINIQTRPGQSGSIVFNLRTGAIIGLLIGAYAPYSGVIIAGINPYELNQTSYCISANHIKEML